MNSEWLHLKEELDRVEGRILDFGTYDGWAVQQVGRVDRGYLLWCLRSLPLRYELRRSIVRTLTRPPRQALSGGQKQPLAARADSADFDELVPPLTSPEDGGRSAMEKEKSRRSYDKYGHEDVLGLDQEWGSEEVGPGQRSCCVHRLRGSSGPGQARRAGCQPD